MRVAGLLTADQLDSVFLNVDELVSVNEALTVALGEAIEAAVGEEGDGDDEEEDEDLCGVEIGRIFLQREAEMLAAFKSYCTRQVSSFVFFNWFNRRKL